MTVFFFVVGDDSFEVADTFLSGRAVDRNKYISVLLFSVWRKLLAWSLAFETYVFLMIFFPKAGHVRILIYSGWSNISHGHVTFF